MSIVDRIKARTVIDENGCHVFQGSLERGYGRIRVNCRLHYAHRLMYEAANGPIPNGLHIDHLCRNRACCNPEHLEAVTQAENNRRAAAVRYPGVRGVSRFNGSSVRPWRAEIRVNGKRVHLGLFATREEAMAARLRADSADPERREQIKAEVAALQGGAQ